MSVPALNTMSMRVAAEPFGDDSALERIDALIAADPGALPLLFARACCYEDLGRIGEAKRGYADVLARDGSHFGALTNLGGLAHQNGDHIVARALYTKAVVEHPDEPMGFVNLGNVLFEAGDTTAAETSYTTALRIRPEFSNAHFALSLLYRHLGNDDSALKHYQLSFLRPMVSAAPYYGSAPPLDVLMIRAAHGGNVVTHPFFDRTVVRVYSVVAEAYRPSMELPAHHVVFNGIGDTDRAEVALRAAEQIVARSTAPVIDHPSAVLETSRARVTERLAQLPGVRTPRTILLARHLIVAGELERLGFSYPLLLRSPGHHTGKNFAWVETPHVLPAVRDSLPGTELLAIAYLDGRGADGNYRKYRVLFIGGKLYPLHLAISQHWKVHYFSADMADRPDHRAEEERFLTDMRGVLGDTGVAALEAISATLALDYGGIDFGIDGAGNILLYEANATMAIFLPPPEEKFAYRRPIVDRAIAAVRQLIVDTGIRGGYVPPAS